MLACNEYNPANGIIWPQYIYMYIISKKHKTNSFPPI